MAFTEDAARVAENSTTTGNGGVHTVTGAVSGYQRFSAKYSVGGTFPGAVVADDGQWMEGLFTYSATNQVTFTTIWDGSSGTSQVTFIAGSKTIFAGFPGIARIIASVAAKATPVGADKVALYDSATSTLASATLTAILSALTISSVAQQSFTASGTYTPTAGMKYCRVQMVGGGGQGGNSASAGQAGSTTSLGSLLTAAAGSGASSTLNSNGAAGGTGGTGTGVHITGGNGGTAENGTAAMGGASYFGGEGAYGTGGRGTSAGTSWYPAGAAGEYAEGTFSAATIGASQTVTIGTGGSTGTGNAGKAGFMLITEFF